MDVFEKLNRTFGAWYEGLFGGGSDDADLRPRDILRRILRAMEDGRREGLDGQIYVPNHFTLDISVASDEERDYLRTFLDADELSAAVRRHTEQHGYRTRGGLRFAINELPVVPPGDGAVAGAAPTGRVSVRCRFDAAIPEAGVAAASPPVRQTLPPAAGPISAPAPPARPRPDSPSRR